MKKLGIDLLFSLSSMSVSYGQADDRDAPVTTTLAEYDRTWNTVSK